MTKLRNVSTDTLELRLLGRVVAPDEVVDVPDDVFAEHAWPETLWAVVTPARKDKE